MIGDAPVEAVLDPHIQLAIAILAGRDAVKREVLTVFIRQQDNVDLGFGVMAEWLLLGQDRRQ